MLDSPLNSKSCELKMPLLRYYPKRCVALCATFALCRALATVVRFVRKDFSGRSLTHTYVHSLLQELKIVYEDDHIVVVDKPAGVLSVSGKNGANSLAQAVYNAVLRDKTSTNDCQWVTDADRMVVHRLGMDTSGLMVFAKTVDAVRGMNTVFRTRGIERQYEALVCGNVQRDRGVIDLPLMRDYEFPPFMRISTEAHQEMLVDLDPDIVGKKLLELPKESLTKYSVVARDEELGGQPVTRVTLTSISGRTHQLNCHLAAFGHPIVGDSTYGLGGDAAPNGGLTESEVKYLMPAGNNNRATETQQTGANNAVDGPCIHAKSLKFIHPITKEQVSMNSDAPF